MNAGLLVLRDVNVWWLSIPNIGSYTKSLIMGRREIASLLKRQKWKEMLLKDLEKKKLRYSTLGINYHVKDLVGKGIVDSVDTTSGKLIRLVSDKEASS
jgi:serine/threonine-protein kinase 19